MEIQFSDKKVRTLFLDFELMARKKGLEMTRLIKRRYEQLQAAETFAHYLKIDLGKPHLLKGNKQNLYAINVTANIRLIVEPVTVDLKKESLEKYNKIIIKGVEDYHGGKTRIYIP